MNEVIVYLGFASALLGFVAVFVKFGSLKGKTEEQLKHNTARIIKIEEVLSIVQKEMYSIQKENAGFMAKVDTSFAYIKDTLERLERKIDAGGSDAAPK